MFKDNGPCDKGRILVCEHCNLTRCTHLTGDQIRHACRVHQPQGPGTKLAIIFRNLAIQKREGCECDKMIEEMNLLGPVGCRIHKARFMEHLDKEYNHASRLDKLKAGVLAATNLYPLTLSGLYDLAITQAEKDLT